MAEKRSVNAGGRRDHGVVAGWVMALWRAFGNLGLRDKFAIVGFLALLLIEGYFAFYLHTTLSEIDAPAENIWALFWVIMEVRILLGVLFYFLVTIVVDLASKDLQRQQDQLAKTNIELTGATRELERLNEMYKTQSETLRSGMEKLSKRNRDLSSLQEVMHFLSEKLDLKELLGDAAEFLATRLWLDGVAIYLWDQNREQFVAQSVFGLPQEVVDDHTLDHKIGPFESMVRTMQIKLDGDLDFKSLFAGKEYEFGDDFRSMAAFPMTLEDRVVGIFCGFRRKRFAFDPEDVEILEAIVTEFTLSLQNAFLVENLRINALTDSLTGLFNHGYFQIRLREEIAKARRYARVFTILMIDLDHFKDVNDSYGHPVGDRVLVAVARLLTAALRKSDIIARYGGEEIAVILTETSKWDSVAVAERLRIGIEQMRIPIAESEWADFKDRCSKPGFGAVPDRCDADLDQAGTVTITASFGLAAFPNDGEDASKLIQASDNALYQAKQQGRNQVVVAASPDDAASD